MASLGENSKAKHSHDGGCAADKRVVSRPLLVFDCLRVSHPGREADDLACTLPRAVVFSCEPAQQENN